MANSDHDIAVQQYTLYEEIGFEQNYGVPAGNEELHQLFYDYYYNDFISLGQRLQIYDRMIELVEDEYGIDFGEVWDWEDFRAWYEEG